MDQKTLKSGLTHLFQEEDHDLVLSDPEGLSKLVREYPDLAAEYVKTLTIGISRMQDLEEAAYIAVMLREVFGRDSAWSSVVQAATSLSTTAQEAIASINLLGNSDFRIEADERIGAKNYWLGDLREFGYCDRCVEQKQISRGQGFLLTAATNTTQTYNAAVSGIPEIVFQLGGSFLVCEACFRAAGGVPSRCALPHERPTSGEVRNKVCDFFENKPPARAPKDVLEDLEAEKISLSDLVTYSNEQRQAIQEVGQKSRGIEKTFLGGLVGKLRQKRPSIPARLTEWVEYHEALSTLAEATWKLQSQDPEKALLRARGIFVLSRICPATHLKLTILPTLSSVFMTQKAVFETVESLEEVLVVHQTESVNLRLHLIAIQMLVEALIEQKQYKEALELSLELSARAAGFDDATLKSQARLRRADIYRLLGDYERGNDCEILEGHSPNVSIQLRLAIGMRGTGQYEESISLLLNLLDRSKMYGSFPPRPILRSELGFAYLAAGNFVAGVRELEAAAEEYEREENCVRSLVDHWRSMVSIYRSKMFSDGVRATSDTNIAVETHNAFKLNQAAELARSGELEDRKSSESILRNLLSEMTNPTDAESKQDRVNSLINLGVLCAWRGDAGTNEGIAYIQEATRLADNNAMPLQGIQSRMALATIYFNTENYPECIGIIKEGVMCLYDIFAENEDTDSRQQLLAQFITLFDMALSINARGEEPLRPLLIAEQIRARNMSRWLRVEAWADRLHEIIGVDRATIERERRDLRRLEVELELCNFTGDKAQTDVMQIRSARQAARARLDQYADRANIERFYWKTYFDQRTLSGLKEELLSLGDMAVVSLASIDRGVSVTIVNVSGSEVTARSWLSRSRREDRLESVRDGLTRGGEPDANFDRHLRVDDQMNRETGRDFFWGLVWPIINDLRESGLKRIVIIPDRELALVPFWPILDGCTFGEEMIVVPSLDVLMRCHARRRSEHGPTSLVGDVTGTLSFASAEIGLVRSVREGGNINESFQDYRDFLRSAENCSLLHIAGHGTFWPENPYESGVPITSSYSFYHERDVLARFTAWPIFDPRRVPRPGSKYRLMTVASAMAELPLENCRVAVLSTCESGVPRQHDGGELLGLPNALLIAGAKSVIASLWKVDDRATFLLMKYFYQTWVGGGGSEPSVARSLALARKHLRQTNRADATAALQGAALPSTGEYPFSPSKYSDAFHCFGSW